MRLKSLWRIWYRPRRAEPRPDLGPYAILKPPDHIEVCPVPGRLPTPSSVAASPRRFLAGVIALAAVVSLAGCGSSDQAGSDEAAVVNGTAIPLEQLERASKALETSQAANGQPVDGGAASRQALQSLIQQQIVIDGA